MAVLRLKGGRAVTFRPKSVAPEVVGAVGFFNSAATAVGDLRLALPEGTRAGDHCTLVYAVALGHANPPASAYPPGFALLAPAVARQGGTAGLNHGTEIVGKHLTAADVAGPIAIPQPVTQWRPVAMLVMRGVQAVTHAEPHFNRLHLDGPTSIPVTRPTAPAAATAASIALRGAGRRQANLPGWTERLHVQAAPTDPDGRWGQYAIHVATREVGAGPVPEAEVGFGDAPEIPMLTQVTLLYHGRRVALPRPPVITAAGTIVGTGRIGSPLAVEGFAFTGDGEVSHAWIGLNDQDREPRGTGATYTPTADDDLRLLFRRSTVANAGGAVSADTPQIRIVQPAPVVSSVRIEPTSGKVGDGFAAKVEGSYPGGALAFRWSLDGKAIAGAESPSFTATAPGRLSVEVTAESSGGSAGPVASLNAVTVASGIPAPEVPDTAAMTFAHTVRRSGVTLPMRDNQANYTAQHDDTLYDFRGATLYNSIYQYDGTDRVIMSTRINPNNKSNVYLYGGLYHRFYDRDNQPWRYGYGNGIGNGGEAVPPGYSRHPEAPGGVGKNGGVYVWNARGVFTVDSGRFHNCHDSIMSGQAVGADRITIARRNYISNGRDDCFENPSLHNMMIDDNLCDMVYSWVAPRTGSSYSGGPRWADRMVVVRNNVCRMEMLWNGRSNKFIVPAVKGHGRAHKTGGDCPMAIWIGNVLAVEDPVLDPFDNPAAYHAHSEGNTLCWLGGGSYPHQVPPGWALRTGADAEAFYRAAKADWLRRHGWSDGALAPNAPLPGPRKGGYEYQTAPGQTLVSGAGGRVLVGGYGDVTIVGGAGTDVMFAGPTGTNVLRSGAGRSFMCGNAAGTTRFVIESAALHYVFALTGTAGIEIRGLMANWSEAERAERIRIVSPQARWGRLEARLAGPTAAWTPLAMIAGGASLTPAGLGARLTVI